MINNFHCGERTRLCLAKRKDILGRENGLKAHGIFCQEVHCCNKALGRVLVGDEAGKIVWLGSEIKNLGHLKLFKD